MLTAQGTGSAFAVLVQAINKCDFFRPSIVFVLQSGDDLSLEYAAAKAGMWAWSAFDTAGLLVCQPNREVVCFVDGQSRLMLTAQGTGSAFAALVQAVNKCNFVRPFAELVL